MMTIGERIRQLREEKDLSLRELAKTIGVSAAFLSDVELGRRYPSDKHLSAITRALGSTLEDLRAISQYSGTGCQCATAYAHR